MQHYFIQYQQRPFKWNDGLSSILFSQYSSKRLFSSSLPGYLLRYMDSWVSILSNVVLYVDTVCAGTHCEGTFCDGYWGRHASNCNSPKSRNVSGLFRVLKFPLYLRNPVRFSYIKNMLKDQLLKKTDCSLTTGVSGLKRSLDFRETDPWTYLSTGEWCVIILLGNLSTRRFWATEDKRNWTLFSLKCLLTIIFTLLSIVLLEETISLKIWERPLS